jgi:hypothetical protein
LLSSLLRKGLRFVKSGCFVNTSRVDPNLLKNDGQRLKVAGTSHMAVGIMLGVATECFLVETGTGGSPSNPYPVHTISIVPFTQEFRRDTSLWGKLLGFSVASASVSGMGLSFSTRKQTQSRYSQHYYRLAYQFFLAAPTTPIKTSATSSSPKKKLPNNSFFTSAPLTSGSSYPPSRGFDDKSNCFFLFFILCWFN